LSNVRLKWAYIAFLRVKKAVIQEESDGKSEPPLHSRLHLAHHPPLPSESINLLVSKNKAGLAADRRRHPQAGKSKFKETFDWLGWFNWSNLLKAERSNQFNP
jgi:hypothetical protein